MLKAYFAAGIAVMASGCATSDEVQFRGHYTWGHEVEAFRPCSSKETYWVIGDVAVLQALRGKAGAASQAQGKSYQPIYVEASGVAEGKAPDGFAADYDGVYRFTAVRVAGGPTPANCQDNQPPEVAAQG